MPATEHQLWAWTPSPLPQTLRGEERGNQDFSKSVELPTSTVELLA